MVVSIGVVAAPAQGITYYERDGYYAKDDPEHLEASAWIGAGAEALGLSGSVDPDMFRAILEGQVPGGPRLGRREKDGSFRHRPGRDLTFSAPKSVSLAALPGGDRAVVRAHDIAVRRTLAWLERDIVETRMKDPGTGQLVRAGDQKTVAAAFRHDTSRNLDPQLHTHAVLANMVLGPDGKWRTMANEALYRRQKLIGMAYRAELAKELEFLGYRIEKTHADGRFEIAGVSRKVIESFSTRRAEIEAAMDRYGEGDSASNPRFAERAALMTRSRKRSVDRDELRESWRRQAAGLDFDPGALAAEAQKRADRAMSSLFGASAGDASKIAKEAAAWAMEHLRERDAVFARSDLLAAILAWRPGEVSLGQAEKAVDGLAARGRLFAAPGLHGGDGMTADRTLAEERETIGLMERGRGKGRIVMPNREVSGRLSNGPLTRGQKDAVGLILSAKDRTIGIQGYAGAGKTHMLSRARAIAEQKGYRMLGLAPSASAVKTLESEAKIGSETLQKFLARNEGIAEGRISGRGIRGLRREFSRTILVVDESSLASTVQVRDLLRIAHRLRVPRVVLVGDEKQLDAVEAGKPFAQLQRAGMKTATMDEILRQRDPELKAAVEASIAGDVREAFGKLGSNVAEAKEGNVAGAAAARWLALPSEQRENTGVLAPSHELRRAVNGHIRDRLAAEGAIVGPAFKGERLVSRGYTGAEKSLAAAYAKGDVVSFHRSYKRLGVRKGEERRVLGVDRGSRTVMLEGAEGETVRWKPNYVAGRHGVEVWRRENIELRAGDRIRWTRNDPGMGLVNGRTAEVTGVGVDRVSFRLEDGCGIELGRGDVRLRHLDHAWASTVHAFQGRTVDSVIAVMEADHPQLTTLKSFYVAISRARDRAELVTDDAARLRDRLETTTGERISALEGIGEEARKASEKAAEAGRSNTPDREPAAPASLERERDFGLELEM